jgi:hypothetical protein
MILFLIHIRSINLVVAIKYKLAPPEYRRLKRCAFVAVRSQIPSIVYGKIQLLLKRLNTEIHETKFSIIMQHFITILFNYIF